MNWKKYLSNVEMNVFINYKNKCVIFKQHQINMMFLVQAEHLHPRCKMVIRYAAESTYQTADNNLFIQFHFIPSWLMIIKHILRAIIWTHSVNSAQLFKYLYTDKTL